MKLYNTLTTSIDDLQTLAQKEIKLYTCGLTVYSQPHIGNWVAYVYWDLLKRTLIANGYDVRHIQNITDVGHLTDDGDAGEDKMQKGALREGKTAWDVAKKYIEIADDEAYGQLGLLRPTHMPRATEYIQQQIEFVKDLEAKGYTYTIGDGVYFDTSKFPNYGKMAKLDIDGLEFGVRVTDTGKKNPTDFALWKFSPKNEQRDMEWDSPWGVGFPGWHLECSAMARELLGDQIDIHTGGIDHIPVHHTNEIAQTESITDKPFSSFWVHANHIKIDGKKMSKSLGNIVTLDDITKRGISLDAFKLLVLSKHYRTEGNFTWDILEASRNRLAHWRNVAALRWQVHGELDNELSQTAKNYKQGILSSLLNDLNSPEAVSHIDSFLDWITSLTPKQLSSEFITDTFTWIDEVTGLQISSTTPDIPNEAKQLLLKRTTARREKNWQYSDELRDELDDIYMIAVDDKADSTYWRYH